MYPDRDATVEHTGEEWGEWDVDRIAQVVGNLVSNAFQHGSSGGVVRLETRGDTHDVFISVRNDGTPIPPADLGRLFQPFQRGTHSNPHSGRSVGLGLFISSQIVSAHGGAIDVQSTREDGTVFTVRLPRMPPQTS
jgi:signal transduction histidine kinase